MLRYTRHVLFVASYIRKFCGTTVLLWTHTCSQKYIKPRVGNSNPTAESFLEMLGGFTIHSQRLPHKSHKS